MKIKLLSLWLTIVVLLISCNSQGTEQVLQPAAFDQKIKTTPDVVIIDVRTPEEFSSGFIANAVNINYNDELFETEIAKLDTNKTYLLYCLSGKRSASAARYMQKNGFKNVFNLEGGILAWQSARLPLISEHVEKDKISMEMYQQMISSDTLVLIDFYAPWCKPCIKMKPMLESISKEYSGKIKVIRLDVSENKQLASQLHVVEIPVLKIFSKGKETWSHKGDIEKSELVKQFGSN